MTDSLRIHPLDRRLDAVVSDVPGSKSIANRALICAALAAGTSTLTRLAPGDDTMAMLECLQRLGVGIGHGQQTSQVTVGGLDGVIVPGPVTLNSRLAGTTSRFVTALAALGEGPYVIDGDPPLRARPMSPLHDALRSLGAIVVPSEQWGFLPVTVSGRGATGRTSGAVRSQANAAVTAGLNGGSVSMPGDISSQYITALMLIAPYLAGGLTIELTTDLVSRPYVALTADVMASFGVSSVDIAERRIVVRPGRYLACDYAIEVDASSASYALAAAAIVGGRVLVNGLGDRSLQGDAQFAGVLAAMGATISTTESTTTIDVSGRLRGIDLDMADISDTAPSLAVVAAFANGPTTIRGIEFIRRKETDRISALVSELRRCGADIDEHVDGLTIRPTGLHGASIETYHDHRIAMAMALVGLRVDGLTIDDPDVVTKSWPDYWSFLTRLAQK